VLDGTDASSLKVTSQLYLPGYGAHARRLGAQVHLVLADAARWPKDMQWWPGVAYNAPNFADAIHALEDKNEAIIRAQPLDAWLPPAERKLADGTVVKTPWDCAQFAVTNAAVRLGFVTIATLDLDHPDAAPGRATILGESGVVYASKGSLWIASPHWWWWGAPGQTDWTYLHRFDFSAGGASWVASGGVEGHPLDSYSLDEADGRLRIATNVFRNNPDPKTPGGYRIDASSRVSVLGTVGNELSVVGQTGELSPGESLRSVRFVGSRGYLVTFRGVDPLLTIDLADPANPRKVGELTLPGFSTYLQPIDETHLFAIGIDQSASDFRQRSVQLSLFDVSNLAAPARTAHVQVGTAWAWSEALWDPHAFSWFPEKGLAGLPFSDWDPSTAGQPWGSFSSDLRVFHVDAKGISALGALSMKDLFVTQGDGSWRWSWSPWIRRGVMAADSSGQTFVYAVSDAGIRVAPLGQLGGPLATVTFQPQPQR
jgi:hypothetical protein